VRAFAASLVLAVVTSSAVLAADPTASPQIDEDYNGISIDTSSVTVDPGYTSADAAAKERQLRDFLSGKQKPTKGKKTGAGKGNVTPLAAMCGSYPCSNRLWYNGNTYIGFHQQDKLWCLVALLQSIGWYDLSTNYETLGTGSVKGAQSKILSGYPSSKDALITTGGGATDKLALPWINARMKDAGYLWLYVGAKPTTVTAFMNYAHFDVSAAEMMYVRVDLENGHNGWKSPHDGLLHLHATGLIGYDDTAGTVISYDPYNKRIASSTGQCTLGWAGTATWGCAWLSMRSDQ
jgi:hypothetical protein